MENTTNIRNVVVFGGRGHENLTEITDTLKVKAEIIAQSRAGDMRFTDDREEEQNSIAIKESLYVCV